jgi:hypothetical protein
MVLELEQKETPTNTYIEPITNIGHDITTKELKWQAIDLTTSG